MQPVKQLRQRLQAREVVWGTFLSEFEATGAVTILANAGLDFLMIDGEHGSYSLPQTRRLIEAAVAASIACFVRVPLGERGTVTKVLDAGAHGIIFPQVRTLDEVRQTVEMTKYPPLGCRGVHLLRPHTGFDPPEDSATYLQEANQSLINAVQIETPDAVDQCDQFADVDGVDMLYVGPDDLRTLLDQSAGNTAEQLEQAIQRVARACQEHGKIAGTHTFNLEVKSRIELGFQVFGYRAASGIFADAMRQFVESARAASSTWVQRHYRADHWAIPKGV